MDPYEIVLPSRVRADGTALVKSSLVGLVVGLIAANTEPGIGALAMMGIPLLGQFDDEQPNVRARELVKVYSAFLVAGAVAYAATFGANYLSTAQTIAALH